MIEAEKIPSLLNLTTNRRSVNWKFRSIPDDGGYNTVDTTLFLQSTNTNNVASGVAAQTRLCVAAVWLVLSHHCLLCSFECNHDGPGLLGEFTWQIPNLRNRVSLFQLCPER
jgi:hypothetical protein